MYLGHVLSSGASLENIQAARQARAMQVANTIEDSEIRELYLSKELKPLDFGSKFALSLPHTVLNAGMFSALDAYHEATNQGLQGPELISYLIRSFGEGAAQWFWDI